MLVGPGLTLAAYLLGSVSFGLIIAARRGVDLRTVGSGNIGATNVGRALGRRTGYAVLALDAAKGFAPAIAARLLLGADDRWTAATGAAAALGHVLPIWHRFRGGKGAATAAGVMLAVVPWAGAAASVTYFAIRKTTKKASVGSLAGAAVGAIVTAALCRWSWPTAMAGALLAIVVIRHASNIRRLVRGEEPDLD